MGRIEKQKRLIIEQANKRMLGESIVNMEKVVKDMKYKFGHSNLSSDIIDEFEGHMGVDLINQLSTNEYTDLFSDWVDSKREYDENNNEIYSENSNGEIMDNRPINPINENIDPIQKYINGISKIIIPPYFNFLRVNEVPKDMWEEILSKVFNTKVTYRNIEGEIFTYDSNNNNIYFEDSYEYWEKNEYDENNNVIYIETSNGNWRKHGYDSNNNEIYYENSDGDWRKYEYDSNNNRIYIETSNGYWSKREYDENNNVIYIENSDGFWEKWGYDSNNNRIYYGNSDGFWEKKEYDENNNRIYHVNSDDGIIRGNRSSSSINENIDTKQKKY
jgi:hypothetical protein